MSVRMKEGKWGITIGELRDSRRDEKRRYPRGAKG